MAEYNRAAVLEKWVGGFDFRNAGDEAGLDRAMTMFYVAHRARLGTYGDPLTSDLLNRILAVQTLDTARVRTQSLGEYVAISMAAWREMLEYIEVRAIDTGNSTIAVEG